MNVCLKLLKCEIYENGTKGNIYTYNVNKIQRDEKSYKSDLFPWLKKCNTT